MPDLGDGTHHADAGAMRREAEDERQHQRDDQAAICACPHDPLHAAYRERDGLSEIAIAGG